MGLDTTHNAWHGGYGSFHNWRIWLAGQIGIPLELMEGFYSHDNNPFLLLGYKYPKGDELDMSGVRRLQEHFPLKWEAFKPSPLHILLNHSDCDGHINWRDCGRIAKALKTILLKVPEDNRHYKVTLQFMQGCELAFKKKEKLEFH